MVLVLTLTGCGNSIVKKSLEQANIAIESKDYDKALVALELALDEENDNAEANKLYSILETYQRAKEAVDENKINEAKEILDDIDGRYKNYSIKEDVDSLNNQIEEKTKEVEVTNNNITKLEGLIGEKNYSEAKTLIEEINKGLVNENQQNKINELNSKVDSELTKIEVENKAEKKAKTEATSKKEEFTVDKAIEIAENYYGLDKDVEYYYEKEPTYINNRKAYWISLKSISMIEEGGSGTLLWAYVTEDGKIIEFGEDVVN